MNKKELISKVTESLREADIRKKVNSSKTVFHITDDYGNQSDFIVKKSNKGLLYTTADVSTILNACIKVVEGSLKKGEDVVVHGFGTLGLNHRAARQTKHPITGEVVNVDSRYVPKFSYGNGLRMAAQVYEQTAGREDGAK